MKRRIRARELDQIWRIIAREWLHLRADWAIKT